MKQGVRYFKSLRVLSLVFSLMTLCVGIAFGQAISGNLVGTISDPTGAVVANAEVSATNVGTSASAVTHSNSTGEYRFDNLPVGTYRITVKAAGFRTYVEQADVELNKTGTRNAQHDLQVQPARRWKSRVRRRRSTLPPRSWNLHSIRNIRRISASPPREAQAPVF